MLKEKEREESIRELLLSYCKLKENFSTEAELQTVKMHLLQMVVKNRAYSANEWDTGEWLINELALCYYALKGNPERDQDFQMVRAELWQELMKKYDKQSDVGEWSIKAINEALEKYEPIDSATGELRPFCKYMSFLYKKRRITAYHQDKRDYNVAYSRDETMQDGEKSYQEGYSNSNDEEYLDALESRIVIDALKMELTTMILQFADCHTEKETEKKRREWYRMFYTEDITLFCKELNGRSQHQRDIFRAMNLSYLDFYMSDKCYSCREIFETPLRSYADVIPGSLDDREIKVPIQAKISLAYWKTCKDEKVKGSIRSRQYKYYKKKREEIYDLIRWK